MQTELDALAKAGEPTSAEQIQSPDIPDDQNAAVFWGHAIAAINDNVNTPVQSNLEYESYPPWSAEWHEALESGVNGNSNALALTPADPRVFPGQLEDSPGAAAVGHRFARPEACATSPTLSATRRCMPICMATITRRSMRSRSMSPGRDLDQQPFLVSNLVSIGITSLAMDRLQIILPDLQIEGAKQNSTTTGADRQLGRNSALCCGSFQMTAMTADF